MQFEPRDQFEQRLKKLEQIQALGFDPYPYQFRWSDTITALVEKHATHSAGELEAGKQELRVAGRIVSMRLMGKAGFAHLQGGGRRIQIYVKKDVVGERGFQLFQLLDLGDSIGVRGHVFRTKTGELSIWVEEISFLAKALLPALRNLSATYRLAARPWSPDELAEAYRAAIARGAQSDPVEVVRDLVEI